MGPIDLGRPVQIFMGPPLLLTLGALMDAKRLFDLVATGLGVVAISPVLAGAAIGVRLKLGSPILFTQTRPGLHGEPFTIYKFRTMTDERDANGDLLPDEERLTPFGQFLRSTSIDELPELFNVLKGDMSLVGPRPLLMRYLPLYNERQNRRHEMRPGITGWAQVNGRNDLSWDEKFELDVWYVDNQNLLVDLEILARTIWKVLKRDDISREGHATAPFFQGNSPQP